MPTLEEQVRAGNRVVRHYKRGALYLVLGVARIEATPDQEVVVYQSLVEDQLWTRPLADFLATVTGEDGQPQPRFALLTAEERASVGLALDMAFMRLIRRALERT